jgi:hypothetical protein
MKGALPWLVRWARLACTRDADPALAALVSPAQNILFLTVLLLYTVSIYVSPSRSNLGMELDSRAGPPVSECVSPM